MNEYRLRERVLRRLYREGKHKAIERMVRESERFFLEIDYECLSDTDKATLDFINTPSWELLA
jgi:hypothetical protein